MWQVLSTFVQSINSNGAISLLIFFMLVYISVNIGKWTERYKGHIKTLGNIDKRLQTVEKERELFIRVEEKVNWMYQFMNPNRTVQSNSPMTLTKKGEKIRQAIHLDTILQKYTNDLKQIVEGRKVGKNPYKIQMESMQVATHELVDNLSTEEMEKIQETAFNEGILDEDILAIVGILLRDIILEENSILVDKVDEFQSD